MANRYLLHRRISQMIYQLLISQQSTMSKIEKGGIGSSNVINMAVVNQPGPSSPPTLIQAQLSEVAPKQQRSTQLARQPANAGSWASGTDQYGFSAQVATIAKDKGTSYRAGIRVALLGKVYSVKLHVSLQNFSFYPIFNARNVVPINSEMAQACKTGDFSRVRGLLRSGKARGSDVTTGGWPMLDVRKHNTPHR